MKMISAFLTVCGVLSAQAPQAPNPTQQSSSSENAVRMANGSVPIYRVTVVARTTKAINYNHRSGPTNIDFRGTALMPEARGNAKVESKQGVIKIDVQMEKMQPATHLWSRVFDLRDVGHHARGQGHQHRRSAVA